MIQRSNSMPDLRQTCSSNSRRTSMPFQKQHRVSVTSDSTPHRIVSIASGGEGIPMKRTHLFTDLLCKLANSKKVLVIKRPRSTRVERWTNGLVELLISEYDVQVVVEPVVIRDFAGHPYTKGIITWDPLDSMDTVVKDIDCVVSLGGDGTLLWVSKLFPHKMPPVIGFSMGTLGYLTQFDVHDMEAVLRAVLRSSFHVSLRSRLTVKVVDAEEHVIAEMCALNECVIDRGRSSFLTELNVFWDNAFFTCVSADGLIIATPTGSTAYSMSAGGAMVSPKVPCLLFTPICPHSLSFRPLVLPDNVTLKVELSPTSRSSAWVAVDGRSRVELNRGGYVLIKTSAYHFPSVESPSEGLDSWVCSLTKYLYWNTAVRPKLSHKIMSSPQNMETLPIQPNITLPSSRAEYTSDDD